MLDHIPVSFKNSSNHGKTTIYVNFRQPISQAIPKIIQNLEPTLTEENREKVWLRYGRYILQKDKSLLHYGISTSTDVDIGWSIF